MDMLTIAFILAAIFIAVYLFSKWNYSYWKRIGLDYLEPEFFYGNTKELAKRNMAFGVQFTEIYNQLKSRGLKHGGCYMFFRPIYVPIDLEVVKGIMQKDFNHFINHGMYVNEEVDPLTGHLFNLEDEKWRRLRAKLTPTFTSGKMKMMFQTLVASTSGLKDVLQDHSIVQDAIDIKDVVSRFTTDVIGSCAFGIDCNSLNNPDSEFRQFSKRIFNQNYTRRLRGLMSLLLPRYVLVKCGFKQTDPQVEDFFMNVVKTTVQYREKNNVFRKDFMHLLLQLKNRGKVTDDESFGKVDGKLESGESFTINELAAQCFVFFLAGYETSATTMTFALLELALNQEIQDKLRDEIKSVLRKHDGNMTYEGIMEMTYLDKIVHETLRKHPPVPGTPRVCNKAYQVPDTNVIIEPGTRVHIPVQAIQRDPDYYPDPEKFDTERFSEENKAKRHAFAFLPFGEGPRLCIGARFGLLQVKVGLTAIVSNFKVTLNKKTQTPIKYASNAFVTTIAGGVWLNVSKLE